jgi:hypothetical protein
MGDLEAAIKPVLVPLIHGQRTALSRQDQSLIGLWAVKTAMMLEFIHPVNVRTIPTAHYEYVYQQRKPPPKAVVWLLAYTGGNIRTRHLCRGHLYGPEVPGAPFNVYTVVMVVGHLVIHLVGTNTEGAWNLDPQDAWTPARRRIWPPRESGWTWPPDASIPTEREVMRFAATMMS